GTTLAKNALDVNGSVAFGTLPTTAIPIANSAYFSGNVGIGNSNPTLNFVVTGTGQISTSLTVGATTATKQVFESSGRSAFGTLPGGQIPIANSTTFSTNVGIATTNPLQTLSVVGSIRQTGCITAGNLNANTSGDIICSASDTRLKNVQGTYTGGISELSSINPIVFTWKPGIDMDPLTHVGFSAQNVQTVLPQATPLMTSGSGAGYYAFDSTAVLALTVNSVKEQQSHLEAIDKDMQAIKDSTTIDFINSHVTRADQNETITGNWAFTNGLTINSSTSTPVAAGIKFSNSGGGGFVDGIDMSNFTIVNIGATGTDFTATGGLTLAGALQTNNVTSGGSDLALKTGGNGKIQIGGSTLGVGTTAPDLLMLDVKSNAGDPVGYEGAMYYNSNSHKFRCFQDTDWIDCSGSSSSNSNNKNVLAFMPWGPCTDGKACEVVGAGCSEATDLSTISQRGNAFMVDTDTFHTVKLRFTGALANSQTGTVSVKLINLSDSTEILTTNFSTGTSCEDRSSDTIDISSLKGTKMFAIQVGDSIVSDDPLLSGIVVEFGI
ncbi:MAG TPA: tail fiber domain-containing protein, partial [Candidatus Saccharimonadales bacterium]|nr:tail fiber domain-containing protein [Candidatus Saccharimonadales bacterium]